MVTRKLRARARLASEVDVLVCEVMWLWLGLFWSHSSAQEATLGRAWQGAARGSTYLRGALGMLHMVGLDPKPHLPAWAKKKKIGFQ